MDHVKYVKVPRGRLAMTRKDGYPALNLQDESLTKQTAICDHCGMTAIKQRRAVDSYYCSRCDRSYSSDQVIDASDEGPR